MNIIARIKSRHGRKGLPSASHSRPKVAGNVFFALFAGIAMVGAVGWGFNTVLRGPIKGMTDVTNRTVAENTVITSSRLAIVGATTKQDAGGDCDGDGMIEPLPYRDAGASPHPSGGGYLPTGLVPNSIDPWKSEYGYCAWDAGSVSVSDADADCGGATPRRLEGSPLNNQYAIAIVSAGRDRRFQTTCNPYVDANVDNKPDTALIVTTAGSDDIVLGYTYAEANNLGNGMWKPKTADPTTAQTDKSIEVTGGGTFSQKVVLTGNTATGGGLILPGDPGDDSLTGACNAANDKQMRRNISTAPATLEICDFTGGLGWTPISGGTATGMTGELVARWKFDETAGATAEDSAGAYDATMVNTPTWEPENGVLSGAASFLEAADEYGQVTRAAALEPTAVTVAAWVKRSGNPSTVGTIIQKTWDDNGGPTYASYALQINQASGNKIDFVTGHSGTSDTLQSAAALPDGVWTHVVGVYDPNAASSQKRLYIDGVLVSSKTLTLPIEYDITTAGDIFLGAESASPSRSLNGALDEVRIYNYALNDSEVLNLYNQTDGGVFNFKRPTRPGQIFTWGIDGDEALGNGSTYTDMDIPHRISGGDDFVQISQGSETGCGVKQDGAVWCWGNNQAGAIGNGTEPTDSASPAKVSNLTDVVKVSVRRRHACALQETGKIWCWGLGTSGQLGNNGTTSSQVPVEVYGYEDYTDVATGTDVSCGIRNNGEAWCWGEGSDGQLGNGLNTDSSVPVRVSTVTDFVQLSISPTNGTLTQVCGVTRRGTSYCWGGEDNGEFGNGGTTGNQSTPALVNTLTDAVKVTTNGEMTCWLRAGGEIWCSGLDNAGAQGNGSGGATTDPTLAMISFNDFIDVGASTNLGCGLRKNLEVWCAGQDTNGFLGNGPDTTGSSQLPVRALGNVIGLSVGGGAIAALVDNNAQTYAPSSLNYGKISAERRAACAIGPTGGLSCWGDDTTGQLGNGATSGTQTAPSSVSDAGPWMQIDVSGYYTADYGMACGIKGDGTLWCWGSDYKGQLGNGSGTTTDQTSPVKISNDGPWSQVSASQAHVCALKTDGTAWCWGSDSSEALGATGSGDQDVPVQVTDTGPWKTIQAGGESNCGIKTNGSLWCWGLNNYGQLGDGTTTTRATPVQVSEPGPWADVSISVSNTCAIKMNGSLWCWGLNTTIGFSGNTTIPRRVGSTGPWSKVRTGVLSACAIKTDGSLWCWGTNSSYQLGDSTNTTRNTPVRVLGGGTWADVAVGGDYVCGVKTDSSVWCWGSDTNGELGNGPAVTGTKSTPFPVLSKPRNSPWWWDSLGTSISLMPSINPTIDTKYISDDGGNHGFNFPSTGRANILEATANELSIQALDTSYSAQLSMMANSAKISTDVTAGLVGKWALDDAAGTTATAAVGTNGTITGGAIWLTSAGKVSGAFPLNGTTRYITVNRFVGIETAAVTISLWVRRNGAQATNATIINKAHSANTASVYGSYKLLFNGTSDSDLIFQTGYTGGYDSLAMSQSLQDGVWTQITMTYDPSAPPPQKRIYVNGVLDASKTVSSAILYDTSANGNLFFGQGGCSTACDFFQGALDDIRIYSRALDPGEVAQLYYFTSQDRVTRTMGVDYTSGNFKIARNNNNATSILSSLTSDLEISGSGNVAINKGSEAPSKVSVSGAVKIGDDAGGCTAGKAGTIKWTGTLWQYCNGSAWTAFGGSSASMPWQAVSGTRFAGFAHNCSIKADGYAYCWGAAAGLGINDFGTNGLVSTKVHDNASSAGWNDWRQVQASGAWSSCGIRTNGTAWCWGDNSVGKLGDNSNTSRTRPVRVVDSAGTGFWSDWVQVSPGHNHTCGIRSNGTAWCWGNGYEGELGNNDFSGWSGRPVQVHSDSSSTGWGDWVQISAGKYYTCGIRTNGTAWCWGDPTDGRLGDNQSTTYRGRPVQVHSDSSSTGWSDWVQISTGTYNTCGIRTNGTAWCWGDASRGRLGDNQTTTDQLRPVQVHSDSSSTGWSDWVQISVSFSTNATQGGSCGVRSNGTAWCWGSDDYGTRTGSQYYGYAAATRPREVDASSSATGWTDWVAISTSDAHTCGLRANGTMWCWGSSLYGRLGNGVSTSTDHPRPVQVQ